MNGQPRILPGNRYRSPSPRILTMDFRRPDKFSKEQIRTISIIHETFGRLASVQLTAFLQMEVKIHVYSVDQCTFEEFCGTFPEPHCFTVLNNKKIRSSALFVLENRLCHLLQDRLYGNPEPGPGEFTGLNGLSMSVLGDIMNRLTEPLNESWQMMGDFPFYTGSQEHNILFTQILPPSEMVVTLEWDLQAGDHRFKMYFCIPYLLFEPILNRLSPSFYYGKNNKEMKNLESPVISSLAFSGALEIDTAPLSAAELKSLKPGDLIPLDGLNRKTAHIRLGGRRIHKCRLEKEARGFKAEIRDGVDTVELLKRNTGRSSARLKEDVKRVETRLEGMESRILTRIESLHADQDLQKDREILQSSHKRGTDLSFLHGADMAFLRDSLSQNPFQVNVLLLYLLDPMTGSPYLEQFDEAEQARLVTDLSRIEPPSPEVTVFLEEFLKQKFLSYRAHPARMTSKTGVSKTAELLQFSSRKTEQSVIRQLEESSPDLAEDLKERMFVMEDMVLLRDDSLQSVFDKADQQDLMLGLKLVEPEVRERILAKLPPETARSLREKLESSRPYRLPQMEEARHRVISLIQKMAESGLIQLDESAF